MFLDEELAELESSSFGFINEAALRVLAIRLRGLLHKTEGSLHKAANIFGIEFQLQPEIVTYIYSINRNDSPAVYNVAFRDALSSEELINFKALHLKEGTFAFAYPRIGFEKDKTVFQTDTMLSIEQFMDRPVFGLDDKLINKGQLISYLANKKGIGHFSDTRDKKWQQLMDRVWMHKVTASHKEGSIKSAYEATQRIANEVLNATSTKSIRARITLLKS